MNTTLRRHPVVGVYRFYENWSTETFRKKESNRGAGGSTYLSSIPDSSKTPRLRVETCKKGQGHF